MCGIVGMVDAGGVGQFAADLMRANEIAAHRGPDGSGSIYLSMEAGNEPVTEPAAAEGNQAYTVSLGHRRLAIIDLSDSGLQPMSIDDGQLWITYNGEVYNYVELRQELLELGHSFRTQTDTEVILRAYKEWGRECVKRFNGMWAFAIADCERGELFCSRDRLGVKPFHYVHANGRFVFASEIKQLLQLPFVPRRINERIAHDFLAYAAMDYCEETFFSGILRLAHGHNLTLNLRTGECRIERYYHPPTSIDRSMTPRRAAEGLRELLSDSVRLRLRSDVEVGSCLSGGLDSSSIVCLMHRALASAGRTEAQRTFTSHFDDPDADELAYAQEVIRSTGVKSFVTRPTADELVEQLGAIAWHQDEPFASTSIFAQWAVYRLVHDHGVKVMLDGQGADEILAGYASLRPTYFAELTAKGMRLRLAWEMWRAAHLNRRTVSEAATTLLHRWRHRTGGNGATGPINPLRPEFARQFDDSSGFIRTQKLCAYGMDEQLNNLLYRLTFVNNLQSLFRYQDRTSMAFSVEGRVPFADYRLVEFALRLPATLKIRHGYSKRVLRDAMEGVLPDAVRWRVGKLGFATPERKWQQFALQPLIARALASPLLERFVDRDLAQTALSRLRQKGEFNGALWRYVSLLAWKESHDVSD